MVFPRKPLQGGGDESGNAQDCTKCGGELLTDSKRCGATGEAAGYATGSLDGTAEEAGATFASDVVVKGNLTGK